MVFAGDPSRDRTQGFETIVIEKEFYDKWIYTFMLDLSINTFEDMKKPLGNCIEKHGQNYVAISHHNMEQQWFNRKSQTKGRLKEDKSHRK